MQAYPGLLDNGNRCLTACVDVWVLFPCKIADSESECIDSIECVEYRSARIFDGISRGSRHDSLYVYSEWDAVNRVNIHRITFPYIFGALIRDGVQLADFKSLTK